MMNEAVKHPERRAVEVGQRRRSGTGTFTIYAIEGPMAITCRAGMVDPGDGYVHRGNSDCCWESMVVLEDCELLIDAPAAAPIAADRMGCHPDCGKDVVAYEASPHRSFAAAGYDRVMVGELRYCSQACADARRPPLAAQPAETKRPFGYCGKTYPCMRGVMGSFTCNRTDKHDDRDCKWHADRWSPPSKPAPQPAPAKPLVCIRSGKPGHMKCEGSVLNRVLGHKDDGPVAAPYCDLATRQFEIRAFHNTKSETTTYTGPSRIARPKLAHVSGMHDDDLIGGAR